MSRSSSDVQSAFRLLPAVDEVLREPALAELGARTNHELLRSLVQASIGVLRAEIQAGGVSSAELEARLAAGELARSVSLRLRQEEGRGVVPAINATGIVLHTGLGRAPMHPEVAEAMARAAAGYCVLEVDRYSGQRNQRDARSSELLGRLTGAEAGIAVNNNAGAVVLVLQTFAGGGREVIVSRGELVEIGGSFRIPDVMQRAGVELREVGTTNRTRAQDYRRAAGAMTGLLMKVHTSNFRLQGFTEEVGPQELAELGRELGLPSSYDVGSGLLEAAGARPLSMLGEEPLIRDVVASGIDLVTFSGDKLLGGPQAGLIVGHAKAIASLRANPLYRSLRLDKVALCGLERTLELMLAGRGDEIPARAMILSTAAEIEPRARELARELNEIPGLEARVEAEHSQPGSGSAPGVGLATFCVHLRSTRHSAQSLSAQSMSAQSMSAQSLADALRAADPPVFARISEDELLLDPRTLLPGEAELLSAVLRTISQEASA